MTSKVLGVWLALLAAVQVIAGAGNLTDLMSPTAAGWLVLIIAALQAGTAVYTGKVAATPADFPRTTDPGPVRRT